MLVDAANFCSAAEVMRERLQAVQARLPDGATMLVMQSSCKRETA